MSRRSDILRASIKIYDIAYQKPNRRKNKTAHKEQGGKHDKRSFPGGGRLAADRVVAIEMIKYAKNTVMEKLDDDCSNASTQIS